MKETIQMVLQCGALGLLAAMGYGGFRVAIMYAPLVKEFLVGLIATQREMLAQLGAVEAKVDGAGHSIDRLEISTAGALEGVREDVRHAERALGAAIRREQASDPPPRSSTAPAAACGPFAVAHPSRS